MYKAIGFDLGGVIIDYSPQTQQQYLARVLGVSNLQVISAYTKYRPQLDAGMITNAQFWTYLVQETGSQLDASSSEHFWSEGYGQLALIDGMLDLVGILRKNGYKVGLLSNLDAEHTEIDRQRGIFEHFEVALFSNEIRDIKPHPKAFQALAEKLGVLPFELIFIDDQPDNVAGAEIAGCLGIKFSTKQELLEELRQLKINCD